MQISYQDVIRVVTIFSAINKKNGIVPIYSIVVRLPIRCALVVYNGTYVEKMHA